MNCNEGLVLVTDYPIEPSAASVESSAENADAPAPPLFSEIEAYYFAPDTLSEKRLAVVTEYVRERYIDGGTREAFLDLIKRDQERIDRTFAQDFLLAPLEETLLAK